MRIMLRVSILVEAGNAAARAGKLGSTVKQILYDLHGEAAHLRPGRCGDRLSLRPFTTK